MRARGWSPSAEGGCERLVAECRGRVRAAGRRYRGRVRAAGCRYRGRVRVAGCRYRGRVRAAGCRYRGERFTILLVETQLDLAVTQLDALPQHMRAHHSLAQTVETHQAGMGPLGAAARARLHRRKRRRWREDGFAGDGKKQRRRRRRAALVGDEGGHWGDHRGADFLADGQPGGGGSGMQVSRAL